LGRPKLDETMETVSVRLPKGMLTEVDSYLDRLREEVPLLLLHRGDAVRQLIALGLEASQGKKRGKK
jgi:metal-responsive CopG/Arc/MetJ family transcriptional regulator